MPDPRLKKKGCKQKKCSKLERWAVRCGAMISFLISRMPQLNCLI